MISSDSGGVVLDPARVNWMCIGFTIHETVTHVRFDRHDPHGVDFRDAVGLFERFAEVPGVFATVEGNGRRLINLANVLFARRAKLGGEPGGDTFAVHFADRTTINVSGEQGAAALMDALARRDEV